MNQDFVINELAIEKLEEALSLVLKVFIEFEAPDYSPGGVREFERFIEYSSIKQKLLGGQMKIWTCSDRDKVIGVLAVRPVCHICLFFVEGTYHRRGIARSMLGKMIEYYKEHDNSSEITVNSSPYAKEAYHKLGFFDTDEEQTVNGIRFIPMKRLL